MLSCLAARGFCRSAVWPEAPSLTLPMSSPWSVTCLLLTSAHDPNQRPYLFGVSVPTLWPVWSRTFMGDKPVDHGEKTDSLHCGNSEVSHAPDLGKASRVVGGERKGTQESGPTGQHSSTRRCFQERTRSNRVSSKITTPN